MRKSHPPELLLQSLRLEFGNVVLSLVQFMVMVV